MRLARCVRLLAALLILDVAGLVVGCGPGGPPVPTEEQKKSIAADNQNFYKQSKAKTSQGASPGGPRRKGRG